MNPPLPVDEHGNWYTEGEEDEDKEEEAETVVIAEVEGEELVSDESDDGLTDAERAILADIDQV